MLSGTMRKVVINYLQTNCPSSRIRRDYDVCYNPELLGQNTTFDDFFRPYRVVIGSSEVPLIVLDIASLFLEL
jgi:UDP-glucose 6-dehydrogenase